MIKRCVLFIFIIAYNDGLSQNIEKAKKFIDALDKREYTLLKRDYLGEELKKIDSAVLMGIWQTLKAQYGQFIGFAEARETSEKKVVAIQCCFSFFDLTFQIAFDAGNSVNGFHIISAKKKENYNPPDYVRMDSITEMPVRFSGRFGIMEGNLTLPKHGKNPPVVILLQGSGPQDADETIGPNKPFKDIALGLASRGIASLRYDKSSLTHTKELSAIKNLTLKDEVNDDCIQAINFIKSLDTLRFSKILLLGHSLGAYAAPRIAQESKDIDGLILLAMIFKPLPDIIKDQVQYLKTLPDSLRPSNTEISFLEKEVSLLDRLETVNDSIKVLNIPKSYWMDLEKHNPVTVIKKTKVPILLLQGARDYQVSQNDFKSWSKKLENTAKISFSLYSTLNHFFISSNGISSPKEYLNPGHVDRNVIEDIQAWISNL